MDGSFDFAALQADLIQIHGKICSKMWNPKSGSELSSQIQSIKSLDCVVECDALTPFHYQITVNGPPDSPFEGYLIPFEIQTRATDTTFLPLIKFNCPIYRNSKFQIIISDFHNIFEYRSVCFGRRSSFPGSAKDIIICGILLPRHLQSFANRCETRSKLSSVPDTESIGSSRFGKRQEIICSYC